MPLEAGAQLDRYEVLELLGAGGMGEVYRAHDARLDRDVAVKVLPAAVAESPSALERFQREARAVAALEHPNILAIHDFGVDGGRAWAAMELLGGKTLRERLAEGPLPPRQAVDLARQIAEALAAAHNQGIVHRDLKPDNVFVDDSQGSPGRAKVLDFGLATERRGAASDVTSAPTQGLTDPGTVMGTVGYMSPEQVRGEAADHRSDIFSFGCVLYEMLTARRVFERDNPADRVTAVLRDEPPELATPTGPVPPALERLVLRCLEKKPALRFQSASDLAFALANLATVSSTTVGSAVSGAEPVGEAAPRPRRVAGVALAGAAVLLVALGVFLGRTTAPDGGDAASPLGTVRPGLLRQLTFEPPGADQPSIAPDGGTVAFVRAGDIYVQRVGGENAINLTPDSPEDDSHPAFSPDGQRIAFRSERDGGGLYVMGATGESVRRVADFGYNPAWSPDGEELVVATRAVDRPDGRLAPSQLWRLDVATGSRILVTERDAVQPDWSPSGRRIVFWGIPGFEKGEAGKTTVVFTVAAEGGEPAPLVEDYFWKWSPRWSPAGDSVYFCTNRSGVMNLWRLPVDEATGEAIGPARPVTVGEQPHGFVSVAGNGTLTFAVEQAEYTITRGSFDLATLAVGKPRTMLRTSRRTILQDVAASGEWILLSIADRQQDLLVMRSDGTGRLRLTDSPLIERGAVFGPHDDVIYFISPRSGQFRTWQIRRDGSGLAQVLPDDALAPVAVSPSGRWMAGFSLMEGETGLVDLERPFDERLVEWIPRFEGRTMVGVEWSPDGTALAGVAVTGIMRSSENRAGGIGILLHTPATGRTELIREGAVHFFDFLSDGRIYVRDESGVAILDPATGVETPVELGDWANAAHVWPSRVGGSVFGSEVTIQRDVWLLEPDTDEASGPAPGSSSLTSLR